MRGLVLIGAALTLAACEESPAPIQSERQDPVAFCMVKHDIDGAYAYQTDSALPVVTPVENGTREGADILNACVFNIAAQQRELDGGQTDYRARFDAQITPQRRIGSTYCPSGAGVIYGGTTYCR